MAGAELANALIGHSGFVGGTLARQAHFPARFRSTDIADIDGRSFDQVVCAGAPGQKWLANRDPDTDRRSIDSLMLHLDRMTCRVLILISTVDVFAVPQAVDESSPVDSSQLQAYGRHRRILEEFVQRRFASSLVVRLPGLVGTGLRKNVLFDLAHANQLSAVDSRAEYQFYPVAHLWRDIGISLRSNLGLVHLTAEPVSVADVAAEGFGIDFHQHRDAPVVRYDFRSRYAATFGGRDGYQYDRWATFDAVRDYLSTEQRET